MSQSRREFIKTSAAGACVLAGLGLVGFLESCVSTKNVVAVKQENGKITVPLKEWETQKMKILLAPDMQFGIAVIKVSDTNYRALSMRCTHRNVELNANPGGFNCPAHGSAFDLEGNVTNGPAAEPLQKYVTAIEGENLVVRVN